MDSQYIFEKFSTLFPQFIIESNLSDGTTQKVIDFDLLKRYLPANAIRDTSMSLKSPSRIFQNCFFRVPDYQRGYAWEKKQLTDFWDDLIGLQPNGSHYTGLISLKPIKVAEMQPTSADGRHSQETELLRKGIKGYYLIDGQQRLATFTILMNEIIGYVCDLKETQSEEINSFKKQLIDAKSKYIWLQAENEQVNIFGYAEDIDSNHYFKYITLLSQESDGRKESFYTRKIQEAKEFFQTRIDELFKTGGIERLNELYEKLTSRLKFNIYEIEDDYNEHVAFETINNRGKRLTHLELLKNRLLYLIDSSQNGNEEKTKELVRVNETWKSIYRYLGGNKNKLLPDSEFLSDHSIIYLGDDKDYIKVLSKRFSSKSLSKGILNLSDITKYVESLRISVEFWYYTFFPNECPDLTCEEKLLLTRLQYLGQDVFRPLVTVALKKNREWRVHNNDNGVSFVLDFFKALENFIFVISRLGKGPNARTKRHFKELTKGIYDGNHHLSEATKELTENRKDNTDISVLNFIDNIETNFKRWNGEPCSGFFGCGWINYFLYIYDHHIASERKMGEPVFIWDQYGEDKDRMSIEHILPQTAIKYGWRNTFRMFSEEEKEKIASSLGNFLPVTKSQNSTLSNKEFEEKKKIYINCSASAREIAEKDDWDAEAIYSRGLELLSFMGKTWNIAFTDEQSERLLGISFIHDGRPIPPELAGIVNGSSDYTYDKNEEWKDRLIGIFKDWASAKAKDGKILYEKEQWPAKGKQYYRFTTPIIDGIIPYSSTEKSAWGTDNFHFYEINLSPQKDYFFMQLTLNKNHSIHNDIELKRVCDRINTLYNKKWNKWENSFPYESGSEAISPDMDDKTIYEKINRLFDDLLIFQEDLKSKMSNDTC